MGTRFCRLFIIPLLLVLVAILFDGGQYSTATTLNQSPLQAWKSKRVVSAAQGGSSPPALLPVSTIQDDCVSWAAIPGPNIGSIDNALLGVASVNSDDAWAVGYYNSAGHSSSLILRWDGQLWTDIPSSGSGPTILYATDTISSTDAWAVGNQGRLYQERTLTQRWDGESWHSVDSPNSGTASFLRSVTTLSANDVWAVGHYDVDSASQTLIEHWDGNQWSIISSPNVNTYNRLTDLAAIDSGNIWAVGYHFSDVGLGQTLILHWDGTSWAQIPSPDPDPDLNELTAIAAFSTNDIWAVGLQGLYNAHQKTLVLHWDGSEWGVVPSPNIGSESRLYSVATSATGDVWAVGAYGPHYAEQALVMHWDGNQWSLVQSPSLGTVENSLRDVTTSVSGQVWAVGYQDIPTMPGTTLIEHYVGSQKRVFTDVLSKDYFYEAVQHLSCLGAVSGYSDSTFRPYNQTTRAQLAKIVVLAEGWPIDTGLIQHFTDIPPNHPFYTYIETIYNRGVVTGYMGSKFLPNNDVTRGQLCKIVVLARGWEVDPAATQHFTDVGPGTTFYGYVETAYNHRIISGYDDGTFRPANSATRAQVAKVVNGALQAPAQVTTER
ncbi:MAG TPA: S-layer homology domain-containing protein [Chloroflexia bacterium]|nr:S-layer homology domain-containing protein [Chloroflexia bacterium]